MHSLSCHRKILAPIVAILTIVCAHAQRPTDQAPSTAESFEAVSAGPLRKATLSHGQWQADKGHAEITATFARTGQQCLHLHGGEERQVTLTLNKAGPRRLSFWAERWTSRSPFSFRIETRSGKRWTKVFDGAAQVRVGRSFLSHVKVELPEGVTDLRFVSTSPIKSGVLIDDLQLTAAGPMRVLGAHHTSWLAPALRGKTSIITKVAVPTDGFNDPITIKRCTVTLSNDTDTSAIQSVHALGKTQPAQSTMIFKGNSGLAPGDNEVSIAIDLTSTARPTGHITASVSELVLSNGSTLIPTGRATPQRIGVALRTNGQDECHTYRIPGLTTTNQGTLIAVYDNRYRGSGDLPGDIDVAMSRSSNGGATWEPMRVIMDMGNDPKWNYDGIGDPAVLVDRTNGHIWVAAVWSHGNRGWHGSGPGMLPEQTGQLMLVHSDDDGKTWSAPQNITSQIKKPNWRFVLQGPGRGITMRDGTLVFAAQYRSATDSTHKGKPFSTMISSRDHGKSWQIGTGVKVDTTESQLVELKEGVLMINCRDNRGGSRSIYTTKDLGKTWKVHPTSRRALIEPTCMASLLRVDHKEFGPLLLFSNPNSTSGRFDMTLKVSNDNGNTWPSRWHTRYDQRLGYGYSCLTQIDEDHVGLLYEGSGELYFLRFPIHELIAP